MTMENFIGYGWRNMKVNRTRYFAQKAMIKKNHTRDRIEELTVFKFFENFIPKQYSCVVKYQDSLPDLEALEGADLTGDRRPCVDITLTFQQKRFAIRMMGERHNEGKNSITVRKDNFQKLVLEHQSKPWIVIDVLESENPCIYNMKKRLNITNLVSAYSEFYERFRNVIPLVEIIKREPLKKILIELSSQTKLKDIKTKF